jgi:hypothetical protein
MVQVAAAQVVLVAVALSGNKGVVMAVLELHHL